MTVLYFMPHLGYIRALNLGKNPPEGRYAREQQQQQSQNLKLLSRNYVTPKATSETILLLLFAIAL